MKKISMAIVIFLLWANAAYSYETLTGGSQSIFDKFEGGYFSFFSLSPSLPLLLCLAHQCWRAYIPPSCATDTSRKKKKELKMKLTTRRQIASLFQIRMTAFVRMPKKLREI
ncbi:MAG: hypothetical protein HZA00_08465 [Nitrospinae bacterium]|nr:hypothetical protein [Nitrospinota bacterium]